MPSSTPSISRETKKKPIAARPPESARPRYSAAMILPPSLTLTKKVPITEATIETAPSTSGKITPAQP